MSYYTLAISASSHDSSICLMSDSDIVTAFSCERINRIKHTQLIQQCDIDAISKYTKHINLLVLVNMWSKNNDRPTLSFDNSLSQPHYQKILNMLAASGITYDKVIADNKSHHLFHAAAGYYTSGLDNAIAIVIDSMGSVTKMDDSLLTETTSIYHCTNTIKPIFKQLLYSNRTPDQIKGWSPQKFKEIASKYPYEVVITPHIDIGMMYGSVTRYIGFYAVDAGKTMGLAAYGCPNSLPSMFIDNTIISNSNLFIEGNINFFAYPNLLNPSTVTKKKIAYNVQRALEKVFVARVSQALKIEQSSNILLGGGCALNILGNTVIKKTYPQLNVYPEPIGMDASQSIGAALHYYKVNHPDVKYKKLNSLYLGPEYSNIKERLFTLVEQYNNESNLPVTSNR